MHAEPGLFQVGLERSKSAGRDEGADVSVRAHQYPAARCDGISFAKMPVLVDQLACSTQGMNSQSRTWNDGAALSLVAKENA